MRLLVSGVPPGHGVSIACGPHDIRIGGIGNRESGFAASHVAVPTCLPGIDGHAGTAHIPVILHVAVEIVGNLVIHGDVVHLPDGQGDAVETAAVDRCDDHPAVVCNDETIRVGGINPDVVRIAAPADFVKTLTRVQ